MSRPRTAAGRAMRDGWKQIAAVVSDPVHLILAIETEAAAGSGSLDVRTQALRDAYWAHREVPGRHRGECCQDSCFPDITDRWVALVTARAALAAGSPEKEQTDAE